MKKRMLSALLVLCTLLSLLPVQAAMAEETLVKDDPPAPITEETAENELLTDYDKLYVGADGSKTANGGKLIALYSAYGTDRATVTLSTGKTSGSWKNKLDATGETDAVLRDEYDTKDWELGEDGGLGYHLDATQWNEAVQKMGITLPEAWADLNNFTVEQAATLDAIPNTEALSYKQSAVRLDLLLGVWLPAVDTLTSSQSYCWRWSYGVFQDWNNTLMSGQEFDHRTAYVSAGEKAVGIVTAYGKTTTDAGVSYSVSHNVGGSYEKLCYTPSEYAAVDKNVTGAKGNVRPLFSLMNGVPGTVYAIRVYDAALTEAEKCQNALVDILAKAKIDPTELFSMDPTARGAVFNAMSAGTMDVDPDEFSAKIEEWKTIFGAGDSLNGSLYVTEGLTLFTSAYGAMSTGSAAAVDGVSWINAVDSTVNLTLKGTGWTAKETGGISIVKNFEEYNQNVNFGMYLPASVLPEKSYTVEFVYNPTGVTETDENGNLQHYLDTTKPNGVHVDDGIQIGPLRCLQFSTFRPAGMNGQLERRWTYNAKLPWLSDQVKAYWETTWANLSLTQVVTYSITHDYGDGAPKYRMYNDSEQVLAIDVSAEKYATPAAANNKFQLMVGVAGTAYSVRVYDRVLSAEEMAQNHVADIFYYYGLDVSLLNEVMSGMGENRGLIYGAFSDIGFDLSPDEAVAVFKKKIAAIWLDYEGVGIRNDGTDGLRYYFGVSVNAVNALAATGIKTELGVLVNVGKNVAPILTADAYDYRIVGYDTDGGKTAAFFVDEDTFAVTVKYHNTNKASAITPVAVRGYVRLTHADGSETVYYADTESGELLGNTLFGIYDKMKGTDQVQSNSLVRQHINTVSGACYESVTVHVKAGATAGGDGTADKPYASFVQGYLKCKELLAKLGAPTNVFLLLEDGEYGVYEGLTLSDADMPFKYSAFEITSRNGKSILTTAKNIDAARFTEHADNVWVCQLDKENGAYPSFRYLYVDGEMADLAYSGPRYSDDEEEHFLAAFERTHDGPWAVAQQLFKAGLLTKDSESGYPAHRADLIASFENYKKQFLAFGEIEALHKEAERREEILDIYVAPADTSDAEYVSCFEYYKLWFVALDDLKAQDAATNALLDYNKALSNFRKFNPSEAYASYEGYKEEFIRIRDEIVALSATSIRLDALAPTVKTTAQAEGKYYLNIDMIGDLSAAIAEGKAMNEAKYRPICEAYERADEATKAKMQAEYEYAAARVDEYTWVRYALEGKGLEMHLAGQWWYNIVHATGVDYEDYTVANDGTTHVAVYLDLEEYKSFHVHKTYSMVGRYVHMKGSLDYVDSEGEYYYDETTGKLYYYSEDGVAGKTFGHGTSDNLFTFTAVKNVTLSDLEITGVDDNYLSHNHGCYGLGGVGTDTRLYNDRGAIRLLDCYGLTVLNCNFHDLGDRAIFGEGKLENIYVEGCSFSRLGGGAIHFGAGEAQREWNYERCYIEDVTITDNYVHDVAREYYADSAIWLHYGKDVEITHNTVDRASYTAISVGWTFNTPTWTPGARYHMYNVEIAYNYLSNFMHETGDGGAIYVTGGNAPKDWTENFNSIHNNYVMMTKNTGNGLGHMLVGTYFDGSTSNWECYENVIAEFSYGAVAGENEGFDLDDPETVEYLAAMRRRYSGTTFIYLQHIVVQITHNILCRDNYILNVRATEPEAQKQEVYKNYVVADRNLREENTRYVTDLNRIPAGAEDIIYASGSYGHNGNPEDLYDNNY